MEASANEVEDHSGFKGAPEASRKTIACEACRKQKAGSGYASSLYEMLTKSH